MSEPESGNASESPPTPAVAVEVESTTTPMTPPAETETPMTTTAGKSTDEQEDKMITTTATEVKVVEAPTTPVKNVEGVGGITSSGLTSPTNKDNIIFVMNKVEPGSSGGESGGDVKLISKPLVMGSPAGGGAGAATVLKKAIVGNTLVKLQQAPQGPSILGKKSVMIARPGVSQLIACAPGTVAQHSQGSAPVVLTQKVAPGGIMSSPVVSTGRVSTAAISSLGGGVRILTAGSAGSPQQQQPQQRHHDVRVDNWPTYCLQRLHNMYDKGDYCDLTLRFHSSQEIKVHRVVVNLCTEYFSNLEKSYGLNEGTLILPKDVEFQTMQMIIGFFYTGKLEVRGTLFNDVYRTVKMMNITILIKLLETYSRKPVPQMKKEVGRSGMILKQAVELRKGETGHLQIQVGTASHPQSASPVIAVPVAGSKSLQVAAPGVKLPPGMKTKTVLARVQSQMSKGQASPKSTQKKLPIWKEKKYTHVTQDPPKLEDWQIKAEEPARPTRFEWGDPDDLDPFLTPTLTNHALMEKQKEKHSTRKAEDIFDTVKNQQSQSQAQYGAKRPKSSETNLTKTSSPTSTEPPTKIPKLDDKSSAVSGALFVDNDTDEFPLAETDGISVPESTSQLNPDEPFAEEVTIPTLTLNEDKKPVPILKPALKSPLKTAKVGGDSKDGTPQKTVRFAPEVEKENKEKASTSAATSSSPVSTSISAAKKVSCPVITTESGDLVNHSKIISEVLRKFPDLVKDNKNIKLKIVQKPADGSANSGKDSKSKVSYIVLKSTSSPDATSSTTVLKKSPAQSSVSKFWEQDRTPKKPSLAENITGPWLCDRCGEGENTALQFATYYSFRRHLVDVHQERIDARICEHCGQKASKRNLLLYHLYTKHGVPPPKNCTFPHCDRCDYIALSESLLNKHKQNHDANKEFCCLICNASFKTQGALQGHMTADLHRDKDSKTYLCPYCRKPFVRNINLKAHIRSLHRDVARIEEMEDPRLPNDELLHKRFINATTKKRGFPSILTTARAATSTANLVEFISPDVTYMTADGQHIEILDPSTLTSFPLTMVSSVEDGMSAIATPVTSAMGIEPQTSTATEYVTSVSQDSSQQSVYVMDGSQGGAVEIDMASMGLTMASDGTMVFEGEDPSQNFIVQDMQGNQFRRITGIDETGKSVMFLQMIGDAGQVGIAPAILDESISVDESGNSQMFVSSTGMSIPVTSDGGEGQQVIFASAAPDGTFVEMVPTDSNGHPVVMSETVLGSHGEQISEQSQHLQLVQHDQDSEGLQEVIQHDQMGQPVQELHIVLDQQENDKDEVVQEEQIVDHEEGMEIVEVQAPETYAELQLVGQYGDTTIETTEVEEHQHEEVSESEHQHEMEVDENSQQLQIDEGPVQPHTLKLENMATQEVQMDQEESQEEDEEVAADENLQESIELVEGQTLTLIDDEVETQTIEVDEGNVEEITT